MEEAIRDKLARGRLLKALKETAGILSREVHVAGYGVVALSIGAKKHH